MATIRLPTDFKEFLLLFNAGQVEYLLIGGYAVGYYGYPRTTGDIDLWVAVNEENADRIVLALEAFGFGSAAGTQRQLFLTPHSMARMGNPPLRIEVHTTISGVLFEECYPRRNNVEIDDVPVPLISLEDLKRNKGATERTKDRNDLENLP